MPFTNVVNAYSDISLSKGHLGFFWGYFLTLVMYLPGNLDPATPPPLDPPMSRTHHLGIPVDL